MWADHTQSTTKLSVQTYTERGIIIIYDPSSSLKLGWRFLINTYVCTTLYSAFIWISDLAMNLNIYSYTGYWFAKMEYVMFFNLKRKKCTSAVNYRIHTSRPVDFTLKIQFFLQFFSFPIQFSRKKSCFEWIEKLMQISN